MANSADPDLLASTDLDLHCLQNSVYLGSAGQGLILQETNYQDICYLDNSNKYPKHMFYEEKRIKQGF